MCPLLKQTLKNQGMQNPFYSRSPWFQLWVKSSWTLTAAFCESLCVQHPKWDQGHIAVDQSCPPGALFH